MLPAGATHRAGPPPGAGAVWGAWGSRAPVPPVRGSAWSSVSTVDLCARWSLRICPLPFICTVGELAENLRGPRAGFSTALKPCARQREA